MHPLEQEIQAIVEQCQLRDVRAAQECADNEQAFRYIVQVCNVALAI
jgi:hypothetical protein